jgi:oligosaccharide repeat unit polymerase
MNFLIILLLFFLLFGFIKHKSFISPLVVFNGIWFLVLTLYSFDLTNYPSDLSSNGFKAILIMILSFNVIYLFISYLYLFAPKKKIKIKKNDFLISKREIIFLFLVWLFIIIIEIIYSGGIPLIWLISGVSKTYAEFGISSVHGLANSLAWVLTMLAIIYNYECEKDKIMLFIISIVVLMYVSLLARQALITIFIELFVLYLYYNKVSFKKITFYIVSIIIIFGILGNIRSGADHFRRVAGIRFDIPDFLLGFMWVYMYMITPLANFDSFVNFNISFQNGINMIRSLIPSIFVNNFFSNISMINNEYLVNKAFNVSTFLLTPYSDFGFLGVFLVSGFLGGLGFLLWNKLKRKKGIKSKMFYAIYVNIISLSFFVNMLILLPIITQFIIIQFIIKFKLIIMKRRI